MSNFSKTVSDFANKFAIDSLVVVQKTAFDIHSKFVNETPKKTGRAGSSWNLTKDKVSLKVIPKRKSYKNLKPLIDATLSPFDYKKESVTFYISNNLPYIVKLSRGSSEQAANGYLERIIKDYEDSLERSVK